MAEHLGIPDYLEAVTRFIFVADEPAEADAIFIPGSSHLAHVRKAAKLYRAGYAPLVLPSGAHPKGAERFTGAEGFSSEAAWMAANLIRWGVPEEAVLREEAATFTWENALFSRRLLDGRGIVVRTALLCCRAFHARRALTYYEAAFPDTVFRVIPAGEPGLSAGDWHRTREGRDRILGEVLRLGGQVREEVETAFRSP